MIMVMRVVIISILFLIIIYPSCEATLLLEKQLCICLWQLRKINGNTTSHCIHLRIRCTSSWRLWSLYNITTHCAQHFQIRNRHSLIVNLIVIWLLHFSYMSGVGFHAVDQLILSFLVGKWTAMATKNFSKLVWSRLFERYSLFIITYNFAFYYLTVFLLDASNTGLSIRFVPNIVQVKFFFHLQKYPTGHRLWQDNCPTHCSKSTLVSNFTMSLDNGIHKTSKINID